MNLDFVLAFFCFATGTLLAQSDNESQKRDLNQLLSSVLPFAEQMLTNHRGFIPYGWTMSSDGKIAAVAGYTGVEQPNSQDIIDLLKGTFHLQAKNGTIKACALAYDIRTIPPGQTQKTDAIAVIHRHSKLLRLSFKFRRPRRTDGECSSRCPIVIAPRHQQASAK